jgi:hypothetical protein
MLSSALKSLFSYYPNAAQMTLSPIFPFFIFYSSRPAAQLEKYIKIKKGLLNIST